MSFTHLPLALLAALPSPGGTERAGLPSEAPHAAPSALATQWGDLDGDGLEDALAVAPGGRVALLLNRGDGGFDDATLASGLSELEEVAFALVADVDGDGRLDLFLGSRVGGPRLYRNLGALAFELTPSGVDHRAPDLAAEMRDYDRDGRPDLLVATRAGELLYRNVGRARFERVELPLGTTLAAVASAAEAAGAAATEGVGSTAGGAEAADRARATGAAGTVRLGRAGATAGSGASQSLLPPAQTTSSNRLPPAAPVGPPALICAGTIVDAFDGFTCLPASSIPALGTLYPLSSDLNLDVVTGHAGFNTVTPQARLHATDDSTTTVVLGEHTAASGNAVGVRGTTMSDGVANGVQGVSFGTSGVGIGVNGASYSADGTGVAGVNETTTDVGSNRAWGVYGKSQAPGGTAVYGESTATTGATRGVYGTTQSDGVTIGVQGVTFGTTGQGQGVNGTTFAEDGAGVAGVNETTTDVGDNRAFGVYGRTKAPGGTAVFATADATGGRTRGVYGETYSSDETIGVQGVSFSVLGIGQGVNGTTYSSDGAGVAGVNLGTDPGNAYGVFGRSDAPDGIGVSGRGKHTGVSGLHTETTGVGHGLSGTTSSPDGVGLYAANLASAPGVANAILAESFAPEGVAVAANGLVYAIEGSHSSPTGTGAGVWGGTGSSDGAGVYAGNFATSGIALGVQAESYSSAGTAVEGRVSAPGAIGLAGINDATASGTAYGVYGRTSAPSGIAVYGETTGASGFPIGVRGKGLYAGVRGDPISAAGTALGVLGTASGASQTAVAGFGPSAATVFVNSGVSGGSGSSTGYGVSGVNSATTGQASGVYGESASSSGEGVSGLGGKVGVVGRSSAGGAGWGVLGFAPNTVGAGVAGLTVSGSSSSLLVNNAGVSGGTEDTSGAGVAGLASGSVGGAAGVYGESFATSGTGYGVLGKAVVGSGYGVFSDGDLAVGGGGTKSFVHPHPSDPSKEIRFVCLEGNESGTYFRGSTRLAGGRAVIEVPEEFRDVTEREGLTVQLTGLGPAQLWVESKDLERIVVRGSADVELDYLVNGVRAGFADFRAIRENTAYRPTVAGRPFGEGFKPSVRAVLVQNGTLNPDGTPNRATAARLGWSLREPEQAGPSAVAVERAPSARPERVPLAEAQEREAPVGGGLDPEAAGRARERMLRRGAARAEAREGARGLLEATDAPARRGEPRPERSEER